jgi:hypothetical protein
MDRAKPYDIPKREVWEAYKRVRVETQLPIDLAP